ncbi:MAG: hypothetical protein ACI841_004117, partial [Planctomycetota bacterium]
MSLKRLCCSFGVAAVFAVQIAPTIVAQTAVGPVPRPIDEFHPDNQAGEKSPSAGYGGRVIL